jgi:hypothetical protein
MTDPTEGNPMTSPLPGHGRGAIAAQEEADRLARLAARPSPAPSALTDEPATVAGALDLHARLSALSAWIDDRKRAVTGWTLARGLARKAEDGAAPTWRLDAGTVVLTDPKPTPRVADVEAFARWYVVEVLDKDPDLDDRDVDYAMGRVVRRRTATAPASALLDFLDGLVAAEGYADDVRATASALSTAIAVDDVWLIDDSLLADLLSAGERARLVAVADGWVAIDPTTGEEVPGVRVAPPAKPTIQMRPTPDVKTTLRAELDRLLGRPELEEEAR